MPRAPIAHPHAREAIGLLDAARILAQASGASVISQEIAVRSAEHLGIDEHGLREEERRLIAFLVSEPSLPELVHAQAGAPRKPS